MGTIQALKKYLVNGDEISDFQKEIASNITEFIDDVALYTIPFRILYEIINQIDSIAFVSAKQLIMNCKKHYGNIAFGLIGIIKIQPQNSSHAFEILSIFEELPLIQSINIPECQAMSQRIHELEMMIDEEEPGTFDVDWKACYEEKEAELQKLQSLQKESKMPDESNMPDENTDLPQTFTELVVYTIKSKDIEKFKFLYNCIPKDFIGPQKRPLFHTCCECNFLDAVKFMHSKGDVDVNERDNETGKTPLYLACWQAGVDMVSFLLSVGADPNIPNEKKSMFPIVVAAQMKKADVVNILLDAGADLNAGINGWRAIHSAAKHHSPEIIKILAAHGADLNTCSKEGPPIMVASKYGSLSACKALLELGANPKVSFRSNTPQTIAKTPEVAQLFEID